MVLMLAAILMVGTWLCHFVPRNSLSTRFLGRRWQGLRLFALATALALASIPTSALAETPGESSAQVLPSPLTTEAPIAPEVRMSQVQDYASREVNAKGLEKFEGGSTTVVLATGGSVLLVVLIVVLIVVII
jgi:hypothetical protein